MSGPFTQLKSRYYVFGAFLLASIVIGPLYELLSLTGAFPWPADDPISTQIIYILLFSSLCGTLLWAGRRANLQLELLFGPLPLRFPWWYFLLLVVSVLLFSLGSFLVVFYPVSLLAPNFVTEVLSESLLNTDTRAPALHQALTLFVAVVFAPVTEEFIFRGFLMQRWGVRWGLRAGIVLSSLLFGALHVHNPVGLTLFGVVMALLYVRTRSLWMPILAHVLNNLFPVASELLASDAGSAEFTLENFQQTWWVGGFFLLLALPVLGHFIYHSWPATTARIPYRINVAKAAASEPL